MENVVIIDSGIGGLTVLNHLLELNCNTNVTYLADNRFFPYGTKSDQELIIILDRILKHFYEQNYQHIFLACNTASVIYNKYLKNKYPVNVYPIIENTVTDITAFPNCKHVGVIGTTKTIESNVYQESIKNILNVNVTSLDCQELVTLCEAYDVNKIETYIEDNFHVFQDIDTLVLGCTHFNTIRDLLDHYFDHKINIICSGYSLIESLYHQFLVNHMTRFGNTIFITKKENNYQDIIKLLFPNLRNINIKDIDI